MRSLMPVKHSKRGLPTFEVLYNSGYVLCKHDGRPKNVLFSVTGVSDIFGVNQGDKFVDVTGNCASIDTVIGFDHGHAILETFALRDSNGVWRNERMDEVQLSAHLLAAVQAAEVKFSNKRGG